MNRSKSIKAALGLTLSALVLGIGITAPHAAPTFRSLYAATNLVSDGAVPAAHIDPNLVNPWGVAFGPGAVWVNDNGTQKSTLYDGNGVIQSLVVNIPQGINGDPDPTGIVFNSGPDFVVHQSGKSGAAKFLFVGEGGTLSGWAPNVNPTNAIITYDDGVGGAVYKGLAEVSFGNFAFLYATDFHNNKIDVFDRNFVKIHTFGNFRDPGIPAGFAPFGIQTILGEAIVVTYAQQKAPDNHDNANGPGLGYVDLFTPAGTLGRHAGTAPFRAILGRPAGRQFR